MSQSPSEFEELSQSDAYMQGWNELALRVRSGDSFSGRERNCVFLNTGDTRYANVSAALALDSSDDSRAVVPVDWDQDGDLDLWYTNRTSPRVRFMRNDLPSAGNFVALRLQGTACNRDAIGARVEVHVGDKYYIQTLHAGDGLMSQTGKWLHFGLGDHQSIDKVVVRWPCHGEPETYTSIEPGKRYQLTQGSADVRIIPARPPLNWTKSELSLPTPTDVARLMLTRRSVLPDDLTFKDAKGNLRRLNRLFGAQTGKALLINLWAGWCTNCQAELMELADIPDSPLGEQLELLALSADGLAPDADPVDRQEEDRKLDQYGWQGNRGVATRRLIEVLTKVDNDAIYRARDLPFPTSFLIDGWGRVAVIYRGPVSKQQLQADLEYALYDIDDSRIRAASFPLPGRSATHLFDMSPEKIADAYRVGGYEEEAERVLREAAKKSTEGQR